MNNVIPFKPKKQKERMVYQCNCGSTALEAVIEPDGEQHLICYECGLDVLNIIIVCEVE